MLKEIAKIALGVILARVIINAVGGFLPASIQKFIA